LVVLVRRPERDDREPTGLRALRVLTDAISPTNAASCVPVIRNAT
jgi:hypothetical protein